MILQMTVLLFLLLLLGCTDSQKSYHGYVYDQQTRQPIANVEVKEDYPNNKEVTYTDAKGYFRLKKDPGFLADLVFSVDNYHPDTIATNWTQSGEKIMFKFLTSRPDTVFLHLYSKR